MQLLVSYAVYFLYLLKSWTFMYEKTWWKSFLVIIDGTWRLLRLSQETRRVKFKLEMKILEVHSLTWFSAIKRKVCSSLLMMFCHCTYDPCCLAVVVTWMLLVTSRKVLALVSLGACYITCITLLNTLLANP